MTRQLEEARENKQAREDSSVLLAAAGGLEGALSRAGAELTGFSVSYRGADVLMVLRVILAGRKQIAFVGSVDLAGCLAKAMREARSDRLTFRVDKYE